MSLYQKYLKEENAFDTDSVSRLKKEIESRKKAVLMEKEQLEKRIQNIEKRESEIENSEKNLEEKTQQETDPQEKRKIEEERRAVEDQRREIEEERWKIEEELTGKKELEKALEIDYQKTLNLEENVLEQSQKEESRKKIKTLQEKLDEILKIKDNLSEQTRALDQKKTDIEQGFSPLQERIDEIEKDEKAIQERESLSENSQDKRKLEEERRAIENKRREIEEERWQLEQEKIQIEKEKEEIELILKRENDLRQQIQELEGKIGEETSYNSREYSPSPEKKTYTLELKAKPDEGGKVIGQGEYFPGEEIFVSANPEKEYSFVNWTDEGSHEFSNKKTCSLSLEKDTTLTANFKKERKLEPESDLSDAELVEKYINKFSSSPELDIVKIKENQEFFNFMLERAKEEKNKLE
jgi:chromosome segregation ATPase